MGPEASKQLVIMAKAPAPGKVKTRLVPPLSPAMAARLYRCLLEDTIELAGRVREAGKGVAYTPPGALDFFRGIVPPTFRLLPQPKGGLGRRLSHLFGELFAGGAEAVCLMNSDGPDLPAEYVSEAFSLLGAGADVVFGPNTDGGYYLVGLGRPANIFRGIPWSTGEVLGESLKAAAGAGLEAALLPPWPDLDTTDDLRRALARWRSGEAPGPRLTRPLAEEILAGIP